MNAQSMAMNGYAQSAAPIRTDRGTEYAAFARVTAAIKAAAEAPRSEFATLAGALRDNHQLWTLMAANVADGDNRLPAPLRAQIFYLAEFTRGHTSKVMAGDADAGVLVDINTAVMRGLRQGTA